MKRLWGFLALLLAGCNLEPRFIPFEVEVPESWRGTADEGSTLANLCWWAELGDTVLDDLIAEALENNKDLQVAIWRVSEYYYQYQVTRSALYPQINLDATGMREKFPENFAFLPSGISPVTGFFEYEFTLAYEVDFWGRVGSSVRAAYAELLAQVENRRTVVLTLVSQVAQTYILLRQFDLQLEIAKATVGTRAEALQIAKDRFAGGVTSEIEVVQAAAAYEEAQTVVVTLERQIPQAENLLSLLLGHAPTSIVRGKGIVEFTPPAQIPAGLPSDLLTRRPDILQAEDLLIAANAQIGVARAAFFPQISLTGLYGGESFFLKSLFSGGSSMWQYGATLVQAIFTGGRLTGQLGVAESQQREALFHYEQVILNAFREVEDALVAHQEAKRQVEIEKKRIENLREYLKLAWLRYYEGQTDYLNVVDAERELLTAELEWATFQGRVFISLVHIYKSLAGGWVTDADAYVMAHPIPEGCLD